MIETVGERERESGNSILSTLSDDDDDDDDIPIVDLCLILHRKQNICNPLFQNHTLLLSLKNKKDQQENNSDCIIKSESPKRVDCILASSIHLLPLLSIKSQQSPIPFTFLTRVSVYISSFLANKRCQQLYLPVAASSNSRQCPHCGPHPLTFCLKISIYFAKNL